MVRTICCISQINCLLILSFHIYLNYSRIIKYNVIIKQMKGDFCFLLDQLFFQRPALFFLNNNDIIKWDNLKYFVKKIYVSKSKYTNFSITKKKLYFFIKQLLFQFCNQLNSRLNMENIKKFFSFLRHFSNCKEKVAERNLCSNHALLFFYLVYMFYVTILFSYYTYK